MADKALETKNQGQTGPKTPLGKQTSAKNARKDAIFVQGYLPWEDQAEKRQQFLAMSKQWRANIPTRLMLLRTIEQCQLGMERIMYIERKKNEGLLQSTTIAEEFCERAGIAHNVAYKLPSWFFLDEGIEEKNRAHLIAQIYDEAADFKSRFSDQLVSRVSEQFPALYAYVMQGQPASASFLLVLGKTYAQSTPTMNLTALMNKLTEAYEHHLLWAQAPARYQMIIDSLRAGQMEEAMDLDKTQRYCTNLHNRMLKSLSALAALDQHELLLKNVGMQKSLVGNSGQSMLGKSAGKGIDPTGA